jgi:hypothetical protein
MRHLVTYAMGDWPVSAVNRRLKVARGEPTVRASDETLQDRPGSRWTAVSALPTKGYTLVGPEPLTMAQVAAHISASAGRPITYVESGGDEIRALLLAGGMPVEYADPVSELYVYALTSGVFGLLNDDVATVTGRPPVSFGEFAAGAAGAWHR